MVSVCFYFQVHQPYRIKKYSVFDIGKDPNYFNDKSDTERNNRKIFMKIAHKCYFPSNKVILKLLKRHPKFRASYSFSGVFLQQCEEYCPELIDSFKEIISTGRVEVLAETSHHSLASLYSEEEFKKQVKEHVENIKELFSVEPKTFRNTELIYSNRIAQIVAEMGFKTIIAEGWDTVLGWRSPNFLYQTKTNPPMKLLVKNYKLSDDIAFRFSNKSWESYPLNAETFADWITKHNGQGECINLFMDYETFGEHQWEDTGIFNFLEALPYYVLRHPDNNFRTPEEAAESFAVRDTLDMHHPISWADIERDTSAWNGNNLQKTALASIYSLEKDIIQLKDPRLIEIWRRLQSSDHFYYMCTKWFSDGDVHKYFNPYSTPYDAFISYMNALNDFKIRIAKAKEEYSRYKESTYKERISENKEKNNKKDNKKIKSRGQNEI